MKTAAVSPWKRNWFFTAPGEWPVLLWLTSIHLFAVIGVVYLLCHSFGGWTPILMTLGALFLGALALTVLYHRALAHRAVKLHPVIEQLLIFVAMFSGFGTPLNWVASHRRHHRASDTVDDVSSPLHGGFFWAHWRWMWQAGQMSPAEYCPELEKLARFRIWNRLQMPIALLSLFCAFPFGLHAWIWFGPLRLVYAVNAVCCVNSICHMSKKSNGVDYSRNIGWLTLPMFGVGENWHANHHMKPLSARLGFKWWQMDLGWNLIGLLNRVGLASQIKGAGGARLSRAPSTTLIERSQIAFRDASAEVRSSPEITA